MIGYADSVSLDSGMAEISGFSAVTVIGMLRLRIPLRWGEEEFLAQHDNACCLNQRRGAG
jgi:hypothetical protein